MDGKACASKMDIQPRFWLIFPSGGTAAIVDLHRLLVGFGDEVS